MTDIILKQGTGVPSDTDVDVAEVAIDTSSGAMYTKLADGSVKHLNPDGGGSGGASSWNDLTDKPAEFPPEAHTHEIADVDGLQDALDAAGESLWKQNGDDIYYNDGNVGIGVTPLGSSAGAFTQLQMGGTSGHSTFFGQSNDHAIGMVSGAYYDASNNLKYSSTSSKQISRVYLYDGEFVFSNAPAGTGGATATVTQRMKIDSSGNVGIGTDSPAGPLEILKTSDGSAVNILQLRNGSATAGSGTTIRFMHSTVNSATSGTSEITALRTSGNLGALTFSTSGNTGVVTERMRIDDKGRVGIGTDSPRDIMHLNSNAPGIYFSENAAVKDYRTRAAASTLCWDVMNTDGTFDREGMRLDFDGRVGIGGVPGTRSIKEIEEEAETTLASWDTKDKKPTKVELVKKIAERTIGGGDAKLQVAGDGYFSHDVHATSWYRDGYAGLTSGNAGGGVSVMPMFVGAVADNKTNLGDPTYRFKDAHFSGTIYGKVDDVPDHVKAITPTQIANWDAGTGGGGGATTDGRISDDQIVHWDQAYSWGNHASAGYQPAGDYLTPSSLNGYATQSWVSSNYQPKGNYQPAGNYLTSIASGNGTKVTGNKVEMSGSYTGTFTATGDIVAYSDVRLKENIRTLDGSKVFDMRGVSFERDGKPSSGVIAQELQEIAPELVHDDGEHLGVAYGNLVGYLIEAVKELKAEVEELKRG